VRSPHLPGQWEYGVNYVGGRCDDKHPRRSLTAVSKLRIASTPIPLLSTWRSGISSAGEAKLRHRFDVRLRSVESADAVLPFYLFQSAQSRRNERRLKAVAADYHSTFKTRDRFQSPLTRGTSRGEIRRQVGTENRGVIATIVYLSEYSPPLHSPENPENERCASPTLTISSCTMRTASSCPGRRVAPESAPGFSLDSLSRHVATTKFDREAAEPAKVAHRASAHGYPLCRSSKIF